MHTPDAFQEKGQFLVRGGGTALYNPHESLFMGKYAKMGHFLIVNPFMHTLESSVWSSHTAIHEAGHILQFEFELSLSFMQKNGSKSLIGAIFVDWLLAILNFICAKFVKVFTLRKIGFLQGKSWF